MEGDLPFGILRVCKPCFENGQRVPREPGRELCPSCRAKSDLVFVYKSEEQRRFVQVRPRPEGVCEYFSTCRHFDNNGQCAMWSCTFAHGKAEQYVWNNFLSRDVNHTSRQPTSSNQRLSFEIQRVCKPCFKKRKQRVARESESELCPLCGAKSDLIFIYRSADQSGRFVPVRPLPNGFHGKFRICEHFVKNVQCGRIPCTFAHGVEEQIVWNMLSREKNNKSANADAKSGSPACNPQHTPRESDKSLGTRLRPRLDKFKCELCGISSPDESVVEEHKLTEHHRNKLAKLEEVKSNFRKPPPWVRDGKFHECSVGEGRCEFGNNCQHAHGKEELEEWKRVFKQTRENRRKYIQNRSYMERVLLDVQSGRVKLRRSLRGVQVLAQPGVKASVQIEVDAADQSSAEYTYTWMLLFKNERGDISLKKVSLLQDTFRQNFTMSCLKNKDNKILRWNCQYSSIPQEAQSSEIYIDVQFKAGTYGTYYQEILFDMGEDRLISHTMRVDVGSRETLEAIKELRSQPEYRRPKTKSVEKYKIVRYWPKDPEDEEERTKFLLSKYKPPDDEIESSLSIQIQRSTQHITPDMYNPIMHNLLELEEVGIKNELKMFNMAAVTITISSFHDNSFEMKICHKGELYGKVDLPSHLSQDAPGGRILKRNARYALMRICPEGAEVYEVLVESVERDAIVFRISAHVATKLGLTEQQSLQVDLQFLLNRLPFCRLHDFVDRLGSGHLNQLFPARTQRVGLKGISCGQLNANQSKAVASILSSDFSTPTLIVGPFGTGKSFALHQAVLQILRNKKSRILMCTHSNSAADNHVQLLHEHLTKEGPEATDSKPLRVFFKGRSVKTVSENVRKYSLLEGDCFRLPERSDVENHRVIISTLNTVHYLFDVLPSGDYFTHILLDEAANAIEPEALGAVSLAGGKTKIVLAGDHKQTCPEVYSAIVRQSGKLRSLLERLHDQTPNNPGVIFFNENYRSHQEILKFISLNFYSKAELRVSGPEQPPHPKLFPLTFVSARGVEEQLPYSTDFVNPVEVDEIINQVYQLVHDWPEEWGPKRFEEIGVFSYYQTQIRLIRQALRQKRLGGVTVESVENAQGKEYRAVFISTVRTLNTCKAVIEEQGEHGELDFGFLSNLRLLNTAMTRAKSLVVVVGDPCSLVQIGACQKIWFNYILECHRARSLIGTTLEEICNVHIDTSGLNPEASEFIPAPADQEQGACCSDLCVTEQPQPRTNKSEQEVVPDQSSPIADSSSGSSLPIPGETAVHLSNQPGASSVPAVPGILHIPSESQINSKPPKTDTATGTTRKTGKRPPARKEPTESEEDDEEEMFRSMFWKDDVEAEIDLMIEALVKACKVGEPSGDTDETHSYSSVAGGSDTSGDALEDSVDGGSVGGDVLEGDVDGASVGGGGVDRASVTVQGVDGESSTGRRGNSLEEFPALTNHRISKKQKRQNEAEGAQGTADHNQQRYDIVFRIEEGLETVELAPTTRPRKTLQPECPDHGNGKVCKLSKLAHSAYGIVPDIETPDVLIKGHIRQALNGDFVLVEQRDASRGTLIGRYKGIKRNIIDPVERQFVCFCQPFHNSVLIPIDRSIVKFHIVNDSKRTSGMIPVFFWKKQSYEVRMRQVKDASECLFVVQFLKWDADCPRPLGRAFKTLKPGQDYATGMNILLHNAGINGRAKFPPEVEYEVKKKKFGPSWVIPKTERDRRARVSESVFTIDPEDAQDLDDALSLQHLGDGKYRVGIHIADASYFVKKGSHLDQEAKRRCTSYYPYKQDKIPMLPKILSESLCSLLPGEERLAVSLFLELDADGKLVNGMDIRRTIIQSCRKLTYEEAQSIINGDVTDDELAEAICKLSDLAQKRRKLRLGNGSYCHDSAGDVLKPRSFESHELIEEFMILANELVAGFLLDHEPSLAPHRAQLQPKLHRLQNWMEKFGSVSEFSPSLHHKVSNYKKTQVEEGAVVNSPDQSSSHADDMNSNFLMFDDVLRQICEAMKKRDFKEVQRIACSNNLHPQLAVASKALDMIQSRSQYKCHGSTGQNPDKAHSSLMLSHYTHFTSPIRRYIDLVVHRLVTEIIESLMTSYTEEEIEELCHRCNFFQENSRNLDRNSKKLFFACSQMNQRHHFPVIISSLERGIIGIQMMHEGEESINCVQSQHKEIKMSHLGPFEDPDHDEITQKVSLTWKLRIYRMPRKDTSKVTQLPPKILQPALVCIPREQWKSILDAVKEENWARLKKITSETKKIKQTKAITSGKAIPIFERGLKPPSLPYNLTLDLRVFDPLRVQISPMMNRGLVSPGVQVCHLTRDIAICIEHRRDPMNCFAQSTHITASPKDGKYTSLAQYILSWQPVLAMEAATSSVREDDTFTLLGVQLEWDKNFVASFNLETSTLEFFSLNVSSNDFVCLRYDYEESDSFVSEDTDNYGMLSNNAEVQRGKWVFHCQVHNTRVVDPPAENEKSVKEKIVTITLVHPPTPADERLLRKKSGTRCDMEFICLPLPLRRMSRAVCELKNAPPMIQTLCCNHSPSDTPTTKRDLEFPTGFVKPNSFQREAIEKACCGEQGTVTFIQGPPGTGKSITGVHIAYQYVASNLNIAPQSQPKTAAAGRNVAWPPQVLYCGPSNKAVDVVAKMLIKLKHAKILRIYGKETEDHEFPFPNLVKHGRRSRKSEELEVDKELMAVALHHRIRSAEAPYAMEIRELESHFRQLEESGTRVPEAEVKEYKQLHSKAVEHEIIFGGNHIILCTCTRAGSQDIKLWANIRQCIIDECGMCTEPETLIPLTSATTKTIYANKVEFSAPKQIVLIGDHKQLRPVIHEQQARQLGLERSMFERLSIHSMMLQQQYRMHEELAEFPSLQFYDGLLITDESVKRRRTEDLDIWPRGKKYPFVFCHVEGTEETKVVKTEKGNEQSKSNEEEAQKVVSLIRRLRQSHVDAEQISVLSPYKMQCSLIEEKLTQTQSQLLRNVDTRTIITSQGSEWDYVVLSTVRSLSESEIDSQPISSWIKDHLGFTTDEHQINVALTRARKGLFIIGNMKLLRVCSMWKDLLKHYKKRGCVVDGTSWP